MNNSQRLSSLTESQTWIFSTRTESCHSANKSKKKGDVSLTWWPALQCKVGYNPNWIPTLIGYQMTEIDVCFLQWWWSEFSLFSHCWLPLVDPRRQLFPWIHRGRGQQRGYIQERMFGQDLRSAVGSTPLFIRPGAISTLYTHSDNQSAVTQLHFLASWTSFGRKRKSTSVFKRTQKWKFC